jgi:hypothetical protein
MSKFFRYLCLQLSWITLIGGATALAQTPQATPTPEVGGKTFEVRLPITVSQGKKNPLVTGLSKNDFVVLEDGIPQEITFFSDEKNNPPVYVGSFNGHLAVHSRKDGFFERGGQKLYLYGNQASKGQSGLHDL